MRVFLISIILVLMACQPESKEDSLRDIAIKKRLSALHSDLPVLLLEENDLLSKEQQKELLKSSEVKELFFDRGEPMLHQVLSISNVRPADIHPDIQSCKSKSCARMEIYNFAFNGTSIFYVNLDNLRIINKQFYPDMQGDLNEELADLAMEIAIRDSMVIKAYGDPLRKSDGVMQGTKTALNKTKCQRSEHLCAAPTFVKDDKALWAIVDLTDLKVVGVEWTQVGRTGMPVTERSAQNDRIMRELCDTENTLVKGHWQIKYNMTRSDGLKLYDIYFKGNPWIESIKTVDWHVSYSDRKGFGYSDAIGCPEFSMAAVLAVEPPYLEPMIDNNDTVGFRIIQDYYSKDWPQPCAYNYRQAFEFYQDGSFRPKVASIGRGCGVDGTYRPVTRIELMGDQHSFATVLDGEWNNWKSEQWMKENELSEYKNTYDVAKWSPNDMGYFLVQSNQGQFGDGGRGDHAFIYITVDHPDRPEGDADLPTIGPCCNTDYRQGPEKFIDGEKLAQRRLVLWYVPELKNDNRPGKEYCWAESVLENGKYVAKAYACFSGPKFIWYEGEE